MTLQELADLLAMCASHPEPYVLEVETSEPDWDYGDTYEYPAAISNSAFRIELNGEDDETKSLEALITRANAVPALLTLLTTQPRLSPELAAALDRFLAVEGRAVKGGDSVYGMFEDLDVAMIDVCKAWRAAKGAPAS